jgi:hypothetical protein
MFMANDRMLAVSQNQGSHAKPLGSLRKATTFITPSRQARKGEQVFFLASGQCKSFHFLDLIKSGNEISVLKQFVAP